MHCYRPNLPMSWSYLQIFHIDFILHIYTFGFLEATYKLCCIWIHLNFWKLPTNFVYVFDFEYIYICICTFEIFGSCLQTLHIYLIFYILNLFRSYSWTLPGSYIKNFAYRFDFGCIYIWLLEASYKLFICIHFNFLSYPQTLHIYLIKKNIYINF